MEDFYSSGNLNRFPPKSRETFRVEDNRIILKKDDDLVHTADFDSNKILRGEYCFEFDGNRLRIFKKICNSPWSTIYYEYVLERQ